MGQRLKIKCALKSVLTCKGTNGPYILKVYLGFDNTLLQCLKTERHRLISFCTCCDFIQESPMCARAGGSGA